MMPTKFVIRVECDADSLSDETLYDCEDVVTETLAEHGCLDTQAIARRE